MRELRAHQRIPCEAFGSLSVQEERLGVRAVNVSRGGACLEVGLSRWAEIEEFDTLQGELNLAGERFQFEARIAWSLGLEDQVRFGVEFVAFDRNVMDGILESLSIVDADEMPGDTFNL